MKNEFDPYRKWLGIPPSEQPANHYRILGIGLFESDKDVISNAADRQMAHVRTFQTSKYSEMSQTILNELSAARVTLLDDAKRAAYDEKLREELSKNEAAVMVKAVVVPVGGVAVGTPAAAPPAAVPVQEVGGRAAPPQMVQPVPAAGGGASWAPARKRKKDSTVLIAILATVVIFLILFLVFVMQSDPGKNEQNGSGKGKIASAPAPVQPKSENGGSGKQEEYDPVKHTQQIEDAMNTPPDGGVTDESDDTGKTDATDTAADTSEDATDEDPPAEPVKDPPKTTTSRESVNVTPEMLRYAAGGLFDTLTVPGREDIPLVEDMGTVLPGTGGAAGIAAPSREITRDAGGARNGVLLATLMEEGKGMKLRKPITKDESARKSYLKYYGGTDETEEAADKGVQWLGKNQSTAKFWNYNHAFLAPGKLRKSSKNPGTMTAPTSATALALLGLLGGGNSPKTGKLRQPTMEGLNYLSSVALPVAPTRNMTTTQVRAFCAPANKGNWTELCLAESSTPYLHAHAWSTAAVCEAYGLVKDSKPSDAVPYGKFAVCLINHVLNRQNISDGGWPSRESTLGTYAYPTSMYSSGDEATVWNLLALKAAKDVQVGDLRRIILANEKAAGYCRMQLGVVDYRLNDAYTGRSSATPWTSRQLSPKMLTSVRNCLLGLRLTGTKLSDKEQAVLEDVCVTLMSKEPSVDDGMSNFLTALLVRDVDPEGWEAWNEKLREMYIEQQEKDRAELGSWYYPMASHEELECGRLYCTVAAILYLQSYYHCPPLSNGK